MTNTFEFRIIGMSRSGNHAVINWILSQLRGSYCFLNCVEPRTNPFGSARPLENGLSHITNISGFDLEKEGRGEHSVKDYLLFSYEDAFLTSVSHKDFQAKRSHYLGESGRRRDILILRDPFNLFASRIRSGMYDRSADAPQRITHKIGASMWKQHAREFVGPKKYLQGDAICIRFDAWVRNRDYRKSLAEELGLEFSDAGAERVAACAGGSSFDGMNGDGDAGGMRLFERWRTYGKDPEYLALFDLELQRLARSIFPELGVRLPIPSPPLFAFSAQKKY